ncbi:ATP synthase membrane subunit K, mitochondrial-like [Triplophysa dalaica]|uniref:ATP synthase membrane subunit K, mitochondrial-like n=1 Tax=Triplophysa dalaica TaxID=1582913 RepID=UPI0024DFEF42|nr:ATP synthase membrane subunit K, mitochondrial-like [Triplophysa dalaica]XP_056590655.1 ATP synthase membrane subunit K, mitochondrial-like [Triplophysa dalaica]XP_056590663.1 ATP synthase membrane subunit K, mitochondrial-like [Triplophysa dalaica]
MPTSPVKTRIPLTSFGHLITEVKRQLFKIDAPPQTELTGWRTYFNSYTLKGRRNFVLATYGVLALAAGIYTLRRHKKEEHETTIAAT